MTAHRSKHRRAQGGAIISSPLKRGGGAARAGRSIASSVLRQPANSEFARRISEVRDGLPVTELAAIASELTISRDQLAAILGITTRTLQRKAEADERLGPSASDRLARLKRIFELAEHVLGDREKAARWLTAASRPLGGELPLQLLDTDIGTQRVEQELHEIKYSFPA